MFDAKIVGPKPISPIVEKKGRPPYSIKTIQKIRNQLINIIGFKYLEHPFDNELAVSYLTDYCDFMNWDLNHMDNLYQSIYPYLRKNPVFTVEVNEEVGYRFAGAYLDLHQGDVLPIKGSRVLDRWLGLEVIYSQLSRRRMNQQMIMVKLNVTAGPVAGTKYSQELPLSSVSKVFKESLKFNKYSHVEPQELFGMQLMGYLTQTENNDLQFTNIATNSSQDEFNRKLRASRKLDCQHNLQFECNDCPVGSDRCNRATHLLTYEAGVCKNSIIDKHEWYIDPERKDGYCAHCAKLQATGNLYKLAKGKDKV